MYKITFNNFTIYDPRLEDYKITDPKVHLAVGEPGSVSFSIFHDHPSAAQITKMKNVLELTEDGVVIYRGRVTKDASDFDKSRKIETEGLLACLNDSIVAPHSFPEDFENLPEYQEAAGTGNVIEYYLGWLLQQHNSQVSSGQQIHLGVVTVTDANNYISRATSEYVNTWTYINDKLPKSSLGGYILPRYENDGVYLDYFADLPLTNTQTVEFGENLLDLINEIDATQIHTVLVPIGADGLTIASLPDGDVTSDIVKSGTILYSRAGVEAYGRITRVEKWENVAEAANLRSKGAALLASEGLHQSITIKACDLHSVNGTATSFRVGRYTQLISAPHGFAASYPLTMLDVDILNPGNTEITLGFTGITSTGYAKNQAAAAEERLNQQQLELDSTGQKIETLRQSTLEQITSAIQTSESFTLEALQRYVETGDFDEYQREVSTKFEQTAEQITMQFNTAVTEINNVNGDLQQKYNERMKYIRFVDGNIILGEEGNELTLTIENNKMTFKQNGHDVAWFQYNQFYVTDAEFTHSARIGNFAFVPGPNGNLSFKKVSDG